MEYREFEESVKFFLPVDYLLAFFMQLASIFLHQNLLEAIKKALNHELPATVSIPHVGQSTSIEEPCKKNQI